MVSDLTKARKIAFELDRRYRVVTLNGELIELSGEMSGGLGTCRKGLIRLLGDGAAEDAEDPKALYLESKAIKKQLEQIDRHKTDKQTEFAQSGRYLRDGQAKMREHEFALEQKCEQLRRESEKEAFHTAKAADLIAKLEGAMGLPAKLEESDTRIREVDHQAQESEEKLSQVQAQLGSIMGEAYKLLKRQKQALAQQRRDQEQRIREEKRKAVAAHNKAENARKFADQVQQSLDELDTKLEKNEQLKVDQLAEGQRLSLQKDELQAQELQLATTLREESNKFDDKNKNFLEDENELIKLGKEIKAVTSEIQSYALKENEYTEKLKRIRTLYSEALRSYGDSGDMRILSQLEKTYNLLKNARDSDIEEIIAQVEAAEEESADEKVDLASLQLCKSRAHFWCLTSLIYFGLALICLAMSG